MSAIVTLLFVRSLLARDIFVKVLTYSTRLLQHRTGGKELRREGFETKFNCTMHFDSPCKVYRIYLCLYERSPVSKM